MINNKLDWTKKDGVLCSNSQNFKYFIHTNKVSCNLLEIIFDGIIFGKTRHLAISKTDIVSLEERKDFCQSHHKAICKAAKEAEIKVLFELENKIEEAKNENI